MAERDSDDPIATFRCWLEEAERSEPNDATAMTLATADETGRPSARMVLLKEADVAGFVFYTNVESRKGRELDANPRASLVFHWKSLRRQILIDGQVRKVPDAEADAYFATRPRGSQIGAWASDQSRPLEGRFELEKRVAKFAARFGAGTVPRPPHWNGYRLTPDRIEFWRDKPFRLHERIVYTRTGDSGWKVGRLYP